MSDTLDNKVMTWEDYLTVIQDIPLPTDEQIEAYSGYVPNMHSWYKKLGEEHHFVFGLHTGDWRGQLWRREENISRWGHVQLYWLFDSDGTLPDLLLPLEGNVHEVLPSELVALAIPVERADYWKPNEFAASMKQMRDVIAEKREEYQV